MLEYIIFPSSYFSSRQIDEDLAAEYEAVMSAGLFKSLLFGYEDWFENGRIIIAFDEKQVVSRPLSPDLTASSVFAWKKYQPFGAAAANFIEFMKETYAFKA